MFCLRKMILKLEEQRIYKVKYMLQNNALWQGFRMQQMLSNCFIRK